MDSIPSHKALNMKGNSSSLAFTFSWLGMKQRWLWNFPEGPCSYCYPHRACQSLTSAAIVIGWRGIQRGSWLAGCSVPHSTVIFCPLSLPLLLLKHFAAMQWFFIHIKLKSYSFWYCFFEKAPDGLKADGERSLALPLNKESHWFGRGNCGNPFLSRDNVTWLDQSFGLFI